MADTKKVIISVEVKEVGTKQVSEASGCSRNAANQKSASKN